ncbi:MAG: hypothetical protein ACOYMG_29085, partial [Candidatus Methylumidiphilus sp.]
ADLVARVEDAAGEIFILHIEIQNNNDLSMPKHMLRYLADLLLAYPELSARQYLVYIGKEKLRMPSGLDTTQLSYHYATINLHTVDSHALLCHDSPDAWVLAILGDFKDSPACEVVHEILARLVQRLGEEPPRLREYIEMLEVLAINRDLNMNIREELDMLTIDFEKLPTYQMGMEKGNEKGAHAQALAIAIRLLVKGMEPGQVATLTDLPLSEVSLIKPTPNA